MVIITTAETHWSRRITLYLTTDFAPWFGGSDGSWFSLDASFLFKALETVLAFSLILWVSTGFPARGRFVFSGADLWFCSGPGLRSSSKAVLWSGFPAEDNRNRSKVTYGIYTEQLLFSPHIDGIKSKWWFTVSYHEESTDLPERNWLSLWMKCPGLVETQYRHCSVLHSK